MPCTIDSPRDSLLTTPPAFRYAVYWVPEPEHPLWQAGCEWLRRDPESDNPGQPPEYAINAWRYGFHATLAAPMQLADGCTLPQLQQRLREAVARACPFAMPPLEVRTLGDFLALRPAQPVHSLDPVRHLADACVLACEALRRPLESAEWERRSRGLVDGVERERLQRWGYPFVFDRWRLHLTLSDAGHGNNHALRRRAERHFARALAVPLRTASVALFTQAAPGAPLKLAQRIGIMV